jgi:hypothetical protein
MRTGRGGGVDLHADRIQCTGGLDVECGFMVLASIREDIGASRRETPCGGGVVAERGTMGCDVRAVGCVHPGAAAPDVAMCPMPVKSGAGIADHPLWVGKGWCKCVGNTPLLLFLAYRGRASNGAQPPPLSPCANTCWCGT